MWKGTSITVVYIVGNVSDLIYNTGIIETMVVTCQSWKDQTCQTFIQNMATCVCFKHFPFLETSAKVAS